MKLSKTSEYAIRLVFYLIDKPSEYVRIKEVSKELNIKYFQLAKVANMLIHKKILTALTGKNGGVKLSKSPNEMYLIDIIIPIEGDDYFSRCLLGLGICGEHNPCPVHNEWKKAKGYVMHLFENKTLDQISDLSLITKTIFDK